MCLRGYRFNRLLLAEPIGRKFAKVLLPRADTGESGHWYARSNLAPKSDREWQSPSLPSPVDPAMAGKLRFVIGGQGIAPANLMKH